MKKNKILMGLLLTPIVVATITGCGLPGSNSGSDNKSIKHNGVRYSTVKSPHTGRIWLDRNLGAIQKCESSSDYLCFGDYYQYGRRTDGHEKVEFNEYGELLSKSDTTNKQFRGINKTDDKFYIVDEDTRAPDWRFTIYNWLTAGPSGEIDSQYAFWARTDGSSICPKDFRVATRSEFAEEFYEMDSLEAETSEDLYNSFLKLPSAGRRVNGGYNVWLSPDRGKLMGMGEIANAWTLGGDSATSDNQCSGPSPTVGLPVRCIMDEDIQEDMEDDKYRR